MELPRGGDSDDLVLNRGFDDFKIKLLKNIFNEAKLVCVLERDESGAETMTVMVETPVSPPISS